MAVQMPVLLTVRGTIAPPDVESVRKIHNETAGSDPGIANARSLGDLSHKVYQGLEDANLSNANKRELLFMDTWLNPEGIMNFFGGDNVQKASEMMFSAKEPTVWMQAEGGFSFAQPPPMGKTPGWVGLVRGTVDDPVQAIAKFAAGAFGYLNAGRRRGLESHSVWVKIPMPGEKGPTEVLGFERWFDLDGLREHYADAEAMGGVTGVFNARPDATVWAQAPGHWNEW